MDEGATGRGRAPRAWALAAALAAVGALASGGLAAGGEVEPALIPSLSDIGPNETRGTIPVTSTRGAAPNVVLSKRVSAGGGLRRGDILRATAELQLTTTCVVEDSRCIGTQYAYTPRMEAQVVLASSATATGGSDADPISGIEQKRCNQQRPNRNHHCVFVFANAERAIKNAGNLPCRPDDCFLNVVASASHPNARAGNVVIVGADRPDGSIEGDKARVDGLLARGDVPRPRVKVGGAKMRSTVPIEPDANAGRRVVRSIRIDGLKKGDALRLSARQTMDISSTGYNVYIGTRMIVATSPNETRTKGFVADVISNGGEVSEQNGFNCTLGQSVYENPCTSEKAATASVRRKMPLNGGEPKPVWVNVVVAGAPKLVKASPGDRMEVRGGVIRVERYRVSR
ncbi:MAG: hypothetical protein M3355_08520 [Actinomycetota bacterium]|nr:hypothetical protein [Actinomycetota bacterium]